MSSLNRDMTYMISTNCKARINAGIVVTMRGEELAKQTLGDFEVDNRLHLVSFETENSPQTYLNYFNLFSRFSDRESSRPEMTGRYVAMLDMGYLPIVAPPSFASEQFYNLFAPIVKATGIDLRDQKPMRFNGTSFDAKANDLWGSRMDMAEYLKCSLTDVKPIEFLMAAMRNMRK